MEWVLIGMVIIGATLIGSIMGVTSHSRIRLLEERITDLTRRLDVAGILPDEKAASRREAAMRRKTAPPIESVPDAHEFKPIKRAALESSKPPMKTPNTTENLKAEMPKTPAPLKKARRPFEEELGARWAVWVGGLALLLGAIFLLRYSIEAGFFTPAMRVGMAVLMGLIMLAGGEYLRRHDTKFKRETEFTKSLSENAYIPGILTAVGIFALLGAVYAAYALYNFIAPEAAFVLLGGISMGALALGLIHGPRLAALGLVAALATPYLVQTEVPNAYALFGYLTIISFAALALARKRDWGWLNMATLSGGLLWLFIALGVTKSTHSFIIWLGFMGLGFAASAYTAMTSKDNEKLAELSFEYGAIAATIWAAVAALALFMACAINDFSQAHYRAALTAITILLLTAWFRPRQSWYILTAGIFGFCLLLGAMDSDLGFATAISTAIVLATAIAFMSYTRLSVPFGALQDKTRDLLWAGFGAILPIVLICLVTAFHEPVRNTFMSVLLLAIAMGNVGQAFWFWRKNNSREFAVSTYAVGAAIAFTMAAMIGLSGIAESLGLMGGIALAALAAWKMPLRISRVITAGFSTLTATHVILLQIPKNGIIRDTLIVNELWIYFALPAFICAGAAWVLVRVKDDLWSEGLKAFVLSFIALFFIFQIRHALNGGDVTTSRFSLDELALQVLVGLSFTLGGALVGRPKTENEKPEPHEVLIPSLALGVSLVTLLAFALGLCLSRAPLFNAQSVILGGAVFNSLILVYLLPAILLSAIAWLSQHSRPKLYVRLTAGLSLAAIMFYVTSMIRSFFSGAEISIFKNFPENMELYTISVVWLILGIGILALGLKTRRQDIRLASAIIFIMTVLKAFLVDMAGLEGVLRALSFVVLGLVLIVIGRIYQRLLFAEKSSLQPS